MKILKYKMTDSKEKPVLKGGARHPINEYFVGAVPKGVVICEQAGEGCVLYSDGEIYMLNYRDANVYRMICDYIKKGLKPLHIDEQMNIVEAREWYDQAQTYKGYSKKL